MWVVLWLKESLFSGLRESACAVPAGVRDPANAVAANACNERTILSLMFLAGMLQQQQCRN